MVTPASFTAASIPDLTGHRVVVTGANSGLGLQTTLALTAKGAAVTLACRNADKAHTALQLIQKRTGNDQCTVQELDLADLNSVQGFAANFSGPLDLLVNNAGIMATPEGRTQDGFELQFGVNHLGHFALTGLLLPALQPNARVVTLSSLAHKRGKLRFEDLNSEHGYRRWRAYSQSKLANLYFAIELERRLRTTSTDAISVAAHPGISATNLIQGAGHPAALNLLSGFFTLVGHAADQACLPTLYAATAPTVQGGDYYGPDGAGERRGNVALVAPAPEVLNPEIAAQLWQRSEELTGVNFL